MNNEKELKKRIAESYDPDALVDILGITSEELVTQYWNRIRDKLSAEFFYVTDDMNVPIDNEEDWFDGE